MGEKDYWDEEGSDWGFWLTILIVVGIVIYILSLGTIDVSESRAKENKGDNPLDKLKTRHEKLSFLIKEKEKLYKKLKRRFRLIYSGVRAVLVLIYLGLNALLYFVFNITNFGDILNWNELALIVMVMISFIAFGTFTSVRSFVEGIKLRLEVIIFSKYENIEKEILNLKVEATTIQSSISTETKQFPKEPKGGHESDGSPSF